MEESPSMDPLQRQGNSNSARGGVSKSCAVTHQRPRGESGSIAGDQRRMRDAEEGTTRSLLPGRKTRFTANAPLGAHRTARFHPCQKRKADDKEAPDGEDAGALIAPCGVGDPTEDQGADHRRALAAQ